MEKILITGITGFIGSNLAKQLWQEGKQICAVIRKESDISKYELEKYEIEYQYYDGTFESMMQAMEQLFPDVVIHTAAKFIAEHQSSEVDDLINSNFVYTVHLCEAMKNIGCRKLITTTSSWEHYQGEDYNPVCLYAGTKKAAEDMIRYYCEAEGFSCIILTIYDSYGMGDRRNKILSLFDTIAKSGETLDMSPGEQEINFVYITDIVNAYIKSLGLLAHLEKGIQTYQIRSEEWHNLKEVSEIFERVTGMHLHIRWGKREYRKREVLEGYHVGELVPGWKCKVSLQEGITYMMQNEDVNREV